MENFHDTVVVMVWQNIVRFKHLCEPFSELKFKDIVFDEYQKS